MRIFLLDGYIDEPSCLGVPPYLAPQVRYIYGALRANGCATSDIIYCTADAWRRDADAKIESMKQADLVIIYAGTTVPGHYLSGKPLSITEIGRIALSLPSTTVMLGGPLVQSISDRVKHAHSLVENINIFCGEVTAASVHEYLTGAKTTDYASAIREWAILGAELTIHHPNYPYLMCEIETFRGCPRPINCDFCSERFKQIKYTRPPQDIISEVQALGEYGNKFFRLGCQTNILSYGALYGHKPNNRWLEMLYSGIREVVPHLEVLHMDNINPATIARFPEESRQALKIITDYNTAGDTAAYGLESADPAVIAANHIDCTPDSVRQAIRIMNEVGGYRVNNIPKLLPGLNFLHGLKGETNRTKDLNYQFLREIVDEGLLLRRINIRQVIETGDYKAGKVNKYYLQRYKDQINQEINLPLLRKVFPSGTLLTQIIAEQQDQNLVWGRQLGTYPILVGIIGQAPLAKPLNAVIIDHGFRSLTALPQNLAINRISVDQLAAIPGIGRKSASTIILNRPYRQWSELEPLLPTSAITDLLHQIVDYTQSK